METVLLPLKIRSIAKFKSYYVVWKHRLKKMLRVGVTCLNRTMQYGNKINKQK